LVKFTSAWRASRIVRNPTIPGIFCFSMCFLRCIPGQLRNSSRRPTPPTRISGGCYSRVMLPGREDGDVKREFVGGQKGECEGGCSAPPPAAPRDTPTIPTSTNRHCNLRLFCMLAGCACVYICVCVRVHAIGCVYACVVGCGG
jgi:hypothetical protein